MWIINLSKYNAHTEPIKTLKLLKISDIRDILSDISDIFRLQQYIFDFKFKKHKLQNRPFQDNSDVHTHTIRIQYKLHMLKTK